MNQLFYPDGRVIGLRRGRRTEGNKTHDLLIAQVGVNGKQRSTSRRLTGRCFRQVYRQLQDWILDTRGITRTPEITRLFRQAERFYTLPHSPAD